MSVFKPRTRQVSFRMSEQEYERLRSHCVSVGARSISDLARSAVCQLMVPPRERLDDPLQAQIRHLYSSFRALSEEVLHISALVEQRGTERKGSLAASGRFVE